MTRERIGSVECFRGGGKKLKNGEKMPTGCCSADSGRHAWNACLLKSETDRAKNFNFVSIQTPDMLILLRFGTKTPEIAEAL